MWKEIPEQYKSELDRLNKMTPEEMDKFMADLRIRASRVSQPMAPEELMAKLSNMSIQGLGMPSLPPPSEDGKDAVCFLCLEGGESEPLRRDCSCRGTDAGYAHLSCLTIFASSKNKEWDGRDTNDFQNPWKLCSNCLQTYQNELRIDIATEFVSFVRRQYPRDTQMQVEALYNKMMAFALMFDRLQPVQKKEAGVTANVLLLLITRIKNDAPPLQTRYYQFEANAYSLHGDIALDEGTVESAKRAVTHLEKQLQVYESIGDVENAANARYNIAQAKSKCGGGNSEKGGLKTLQELYELRIAQYGKEHAVTIEAGMVYALELQEANHKGGATELLTKLLSTSKRVLGPHHKITKKVKSNLELVRMGFSGRYVPTRVGW